jgi:hypothetical protein
MNDNRIVVVAGIPRSGTTLMMNMLFHGGMRVHADDTVGFETSDFHGLPDDLSLFRNSRNKAVKILDPHRVKFPGGYDYRIIFMERNQLEQAKSNIKFLIYMKQITSKQPNSVIWKMQKSIMKDTKRCLRQLPKIVKSKSHFIRVRFENVLDDPFAEAKRVVECIGYDLEIGRMVSAIIKRDPGCLYYMLEERLTKQSRVWMPGMS